MNDIQAERILKRNFHHMMINKDFDAFKRNFPTLYRVVIESIKQGRYMKI